MKNYRLRTAVLFLSLLWLSACAILDKTAERPGGAQTPANQGAAQFGPAPTRVAAPSTLAVAPATSSARPASASNLSSAADPTKTDPYKIFKGSGALLNQASPPKDGAPPSEEIVLNFEGVDIRTVIETILSQYLREPYVVHPSVAGTITLRTTRGIARKDLIPILEMLLRQNGFALVREDGLYKVLPFNQVRGSITPQLGSASTPIPNGFSVLIVPLKYIGAKAMKDILEPFTTDGSAVRADEVRNLVILAGGQRELKHLQETIDLFDVDFLSGMSVGLFTVKSAEVKGMVAEIDKIFGAAGNPLAGIVRVIPIERLNALLIVTTQPKYLDEAKKWIERLDQPTGAGSGLYVYQVKNGKAESLATLLSDIFGGKPSTGGGQPQLAPGARPAEIRSPTQPGYTMPAGTQQPAFSAQAAQTTQFQGDGIVVSKDVRVVADKDNNALLIIASQSDYAKIEQALSKLDVVRRQVLVELTVAEVTLSDDLKFGIDWFINARSGTSNGLSNVTTGTLNLGGLPATPTAAVPGFNGLQLINRLGGDVRGVLNALGQDGRLQVLASPQVMVLDNEKAEIKVGDRISVQTQSQTVVGTTTGLVNSFQYLDTGILLAVTPRINASGQVTLEVRQEFSVPDASASAGSNPTINTRSAQTSVIVNSGESMVLGGLIQESKTRSTSGVPLLSKIPILGAAFGTQSIINRRTELVIMITPRVVANAAQAQDVTNELRRKLPALESLLTKPRAETNIVPGKN